MRALFAEGQDRSFLCRDIEGIHVDASRQRLDAEAWGELLRVAGADRAGSVRLVCRRTGEYDGKSPGSASGTAQPTLGGVWSWRGSTSSPKMHRQRRRMRQFAQTCTARWQTVVNLGIGGSDLGPRMLCEAFSRAPGAPDVRFASTLDPEELSAVLHGCDAHQTLFIVASKTFTTEETQRNFSAARQWLENQGVGSGEVMEHFAATTAAVERAQEGRH